jgi:hypothetical protein
MSFPEVPDLTRVGSWTLENAAAIAFNYDCFDNDVFRDLLAAFIKKHIPDNEDPEKEDVVLGMIFIRILGANGLRRQT